jgi:acetylglutamate kinase
MKPIVVKVGGSTLGSHDTAIEDIAALHEGGRPVVVVHGGGNAATEWLKVHGVATEFVNGLRVTGPDAIDVVAAVFAGLVNKQLVSQLLGRGTKAVGLSGVDGGMIATRRLDDRLGFVGEVTAVDPKPIEALLGAGYLPVVSPLAFLEGRPQQLMNVNADTIAGEVAAALGASLLVFLTDVPGVKDEAGQWVEDLTVDAAQGLLASGVAAGGMAPKLEACIRAAGAGVRAQIIDGREPHALKAALDGAAAGTAIG